MARSPTSPGCRASAGMPYTEDPAELAGADVAIVGAPTDDLVSDRPGARFGPRAIRARVPARPAPGGGIDGIAELRVVDYGDAPVLPADPAASHAAIERTVGEVLDAGAIPIVLGGDHGIAEPDIRACAARDRGRGRPGPLRPPHRHRRRGLRGQGLPRHADAPLGRGRGTSIQNATCRWACAATGRGSEEFAWQAERGIISLFMHELRELGIEDGRRAGCGSGAGGDRYTSRSISTSSTRPSRRGPVLPSRAG